MDLRDVISNVSNYSNRVKATSQQQMYSTKCTKGVLPLSLSALPQQAISNVHFYILELVILLPVLQSLPVLPSLGNAIG